MEPVRVRLHATGGASRRKKGVQGFNTAARRLIHVLLGGGGVGITTNFAVGEREVAPSPTSSDSQKLPAQLPAEAEV